MSPTLEERNVALQSIADYQDARIERLQAELDEAQATLEARDSLLALSTAILRMATAHVKSLQADLDDANEALDEAEAIFDQYDALQAEVESLRAHAPKVSREASLPITDAELRKVWYGFPVRLSLAPGAPEVSVFQCNLLAVWFEGGIIVVMKNNRDTDAEAIERAREVL